MGGRIAKAHCFFEQSGTFKNEFKKLGVPAFDYDILNDFNETDFVIDLYNEIEKAYKEEASIFDSISSKDLVFAFFPCIRFETQIILWFRGECCLQKEWNDERKLEYALKLHEDLSKNYEVITKLVLVCLKRKLKLIIENPYSEQHYLTRYWPIKAKYIDYDRTQTGDYEKKPTQFWFINCEPKHNFIFEAVHIKPRIRHNDLWAKKNFTVLRSMISPDYANRFIREHIIDEEGS